MFESRMEQYPPPGGYSTTGGGVLPIAKIDGRPLPAFPGPVTRRLQELYQTLAAARANTTK